MQQNDVGIPYDVSGLVYVLYGKRLVGTGCHRDEILTGRVDGDQRHTRRILVVGIYIPRVNLFRFVDFHGLNAEQIITYFGDERNFGTEAGAGQCLIGVFASGTHEKSAAQDSFTRNRQTIGLNDHIRIGAADDHDLGSFIGIESHGIWL